MNDTPTVEQIAAGLSAVNDHMETIYPMGEPWPTVTEEGVVAAYLAMRALDPVLAEAREALEAAADELENCADQFRGLKMPTCAECADNAQSGTRAAFRSITAEPE